MNRALYLTQLKFVCRAYGMRFTRSTKNLDTKIKYKFLISCLVKYSLSISFTGKKIKLARKHLSVVSQMHDFMSINQNYRDFFSKSPKLRFFINSIRHYPLEWRKLSIFIYLNLRQAKYLEIVVIRMDMTRTALLDVKIFYFKSLNFFSSA